MSKEKYNQIVDEAYENYYENFYKLSDSKKWMKKNFFYDGSSNHHVYLKEEFINKCKTDTEFSEKWGLKIEERELSLEERLILNPGTPNENIDYLLDPNNFPHIDSELELKNNLDYKNIPTKLITLTYNNETIESYE